MLIIFWSMWLVCFQVRVLAAKRIKKKKKVHYLYAQKVHYIVPSNFCLSDTLITCLSCSRNHRNNTKLIVNPMSILYVYKMIKHLYNNIAISTHSIDCYNIILMRVSYAFCVCVCFSVFFFPALPPSIMYNIK